MTDAVKNPSLVIFASDQGPGDAERSSIMSQAGSFLAREGARIICINHGSDLCIPLITSARSAGGEVIILAESEFVAPAGLSDVPIERLSTKPEIYQRTGELADAFVGLPGSLASATSLFDAWTAAGEGKPVALLNKNRAYEFLRGFMVDVMSSKIKNLDRHLHVADNIEDLWNRLSRHLPSS